MIANPAYYLDEFTDEIMPSDLEGCTLAGWAKWLSKGGESANEDGETGCWTFAPPKDCTVYSASCLSFLPDIEITRLADEDCEPRFRWSRPLDHDIQFAALRFGPGMGWGPDDIICDTDSQTTIEAEIADDCWPKMEIGETSILAVARNRNTTLIYRADPPRLVEAASADTHPKGGDVEQAPSPMSGFGRRRRDAQWASPTTYRGGRQ